MDRIFGTHDQTKPRRMGGHGAIVVARVNTTCSANINYRWRGKPYPHPHPHPHPQSSEFMIEPIYTNSKHPHPHPHSPRLRIQAPAVLKRATGCVPDSPGFALDRLPYGDLEAPKTRRPGSTQARMKRWQEGSLSKAPGRTRRLGVPWHRRLC